jgi:hypothetical protein
LAVPLLGWLGASLGASIAGAGCSHSGAVHVTIDLPDDPDLSPAADLARLQLVSEVGGAPGQPTNRDVTSTMAGADIDFGTVSIHPGVRLSLIGFATTGRLVGFGRASAPITVTSDASQAVTIPLRRPFAYIAGGDALVACDTTVEPGAPFALTIDAAPQPVAAAATPDGTQVVAVGGSQLVALSTSRHMASGGVPATLAAGASAVAISPDSRWAVVVHGGAAAPMSGVSVVDLKAGGAAAFVAVDNADAVAVSADTAYVLQNATDACTGQSTIVPVRLGATALAGTGFGLASAARDIAIGPDGTTLLVAEPCADAVWALRDDGKTQVKVAKLTSPTNVAVNGDRVWGVGRESQGGAHLVLASANLDGTAAAPLSLPPTQELAKSTDLTEAGQTTEVRLDPDQVDAYSLSVLPDGRSVALLVHATYHAAPIVRPVSFNGTIFDETIVPGIDMETYEYQLIDVTTGSLTQRLRTRCKINWDPGAVLDNWACARALGQDTTDMDFVANQVTVLYGAR